MAMWWCCVVHGLEVVQLVIVACYHVVNGVGSGLSAEVADSVVPLEDYESASSPVFGKSLASGAAEPRWSLVLLAPAVLNRFVWAPGLEAGGGCKNQGGWVLSLLGHPSGDEARGVSFLTGVGSFLRRQ